MSSSPSKPRPDLAQGATGPRAEALAADYLARRGLTIVGRNFRTRFGEIDLIARDGRTLVFVEVRMRRSLRFGGAVESISAAKRERMIAAANGYLAMRNFAYSFLGPRLDPCEAAPEEGALALVAR